MAVVQKEAVKWIIIFISSVQIGNSSSDFGGIIPGLDGREDRYKQFLNCNSLSMHCFFDHPFDREMLIVPTFVGGLRSDFSV